MRMSPKVISVPLTCRCGYDLTCRTMVTADIDLSTFKVLALQSVIDPDDLDAARKHAAAHGF